MDHVIEGNLTDWQIQPYEGRIVNGKLYGRGVGDMKGALAAMVHAAPLAKESGPKIIVTAVVLEERSGATGTRFAVKENHLDVNFAICGEASEFEIRDAGKGRLEIEVETKGKPAHSSAPQQGINALYHMARIITVIEEHANELPVDDYLGPASLSVNYITAQPDFWGDDIVPYFCKIILERRPLPSETKEQVLTGISNCIAEVTGSVPQLNAIVRIRQGHLRAWTGLEVEEDMWLAPWHNTNAQLIEAGKAAVTQVLGEPPNVGPYPFGTDASYLCGEAGIPTIGLGPGTPKYLHTPQELLPIKDLIAARDIYAALPFCLNAQL